MDGTCLATKRDVWITSTVVYTVARFMPIPFLTGVVDAEMAQSEGGEAVHLANRGDEEIQVGFLL